MKSFDKNTNPAGEAAFRELKELLESNLAAMLYMNKNTPNKIPARYVTKNRAALKALPKTVSTLVETRFKVGRG